MSLQPVSQPGPKSPPAAKKPASQTPPSEPVDSFVYKATRTVAGGLSAALGAAAGAVVGGFQKAGARQTQLPAKLHTLARYAGAVVIAGGAITAGVMTGGAAGLALAVIGGNPLVAGALAGGLPSAVEAGSDALRGAASGGATGGLIGWNVATEALDWITGHGRKPQKPDPTATPRPPGKTPD
ncbi:MAG: hypothetical protein HY319_30610 [Armatimonadetes bacterium]|nr:hypothetical protein [Armatimonadota bacterium]